MNAAGDNSPAWVRGTVFASAVLAFGATGSARADALPVVAVERQVTQAAQGHVLTNHAVWSPDGQWLAYDLRAVSENFTGTRIEAINVATGVVRTLYTAPLGSHCGVVTWHPVQPRVIFIQGPEPETETWSYGASRRRGVMVDFGGDGTGHALDAANYAPPFAPGALRGGSHVHQFSPDGTRVSFTYDDELLARPPADGIAREPNQRNVGVAVPAGPVQVNRNHPRNHDGEWFSVLVTRTVAQPRPGSDEISRACEEGWIGTDGYARADGTPQRHALAFQGTVVAGDGREHVEVFIVDLPDDLTPPGEAPLEGTATLRPAPPRGVQQRRLTFTEARTARGLQGPRHWLRSSPDGSRIAFLMKDDAGVVQLWTVSPNGGEPHQLTRNPADIASAFSWSSDGRLIAHAMDGSVCVTSARTGATLRLTPRREPAAAPLPLACVFSPDGRHIAYQRSVPDAGGTVFAQIFTVTLPPDLADLLP